MPTSVRRRSLGGALALLLAALARLEPGAARGSGLRCYNFGSPPVLSHASGGGGEAVLQARPGPPPCAPCGAAARPHSPPLSRFVMARPHDAVRETLPVHCAAHPSARASLPVVPNPAQMKLC